MTFRPLPDINPDSAPYWKGLAESKILLQRCKACRVHQFYPRYHCASCAGEVEWVEASASAKVHTFTIVRQNLTPGFKELGPYVLAMVELAEGVRMMTNIVGCEPSAVKIDMPLVPVFEKVDDETGLLFWKPA